MKEFLVSIFYALVLFFIIIVSGQEEEEEEKFSTKYDNIDMDGILKSKRLVKFYAECIVGEGRCSDDARFARDSLDDMILTNCSRCSDKQKANAFKIAKHMILNEPGYTKQFRQRYDPEDNYWRAIKKEAARHGYNLSKIYNETD